MCLSQIGKLSPSVDGNAQATESTMHPNKFFKSKL